jgi:ABC-type dipeptide/oligopeptide/nickel transport system permease subunit
VVKAAASGIMLFALLALFGPLLAPFDPREPVGASLLPPSARHLLGTDDVGRDILSQVIAGTRISLIVGLTASIATTLVGFIAGMAAGCSGGAVDGVIMRCVDVFLVLPRLPLLILLAAYFGAGLHIIAIAFVITSWAAPARVVRGQVLLEKERTFVRAARLSGAKTGYVLKKHIIPQLIPVLSALLIMEASHAVMAEAGLAFLGLGDPTYISWGTILHHAFMFPALFLSDAWLWWALPPGICLSFLLLSFAFINLRIERKVDPRLKGRFYAL